MEGEKDCPAILSSIKKIKSSNFSIINILKGNTLFYKIKDFYLVITKYKNIS